MRVADDKLVLVAGDSVNSVALRIVDLLGSDFDESALTTVDIAPGLETSRLDYVAASNDKVFFRAFDSTVGFEPRVLDLTAPVLDETAVTTIDLAGPNFGSDPHYFVVAGDKVAFSLTDRLLGPELAILDLNAGSLDADAVTILDILDGTPGGRASQLLAVGDQVVFSYGVSREVAVVDLSGEDIDLSAVTLFDLKNGASGSSPNRFVGADDKAVFTASFGVNSREELQVLDLTADPLDDSAIATIDLVAGRNSSSPCAIIVAGDKAIFQATDAQNGAELRILDLSAQNLDVSAVTTIDLVAGRDGSGPGDFAVAGDKLVFSAGDPSNGLELQALDLSASPLDASAVVAIDLVPGAVSSNPRDMIAVGDKIVFSAFDVEHRRELRVLDLSAPSLDASAVTTIDLFEEPTGSEPWSDFVVDGDIVYFSAEDRAFGREIRALDLSAPLLDASAVQTIDIETAPQIYPSFRSAIDLGALRDQRPNRRAQLRLPARF